MAASKLTVRLPAVLHQRLRRWAQRNDRSLNQVIIDAVAELLEREVVRGRASARARALQVLTSRGLCEPLPTPSLSGEPLTDTPQLADLRQEIGWLSPPLSETIILERGSR